jgi:hypothetical protein
VEDVVIQEEIIYMYIHTYIYIRKKGRGKTSTTLFKQVARNTAADSYIAMRIMACNNSRWKAANQSKDCRIRRSTDDGIEEGMMFSTSLNY